MFARDGLDAVHRMNPKQGSRRIKPQRLAIVGPVKLKYSSQRGYSVLFDVYQEDRYAETRLCARRGLAGEPLSSCKFGIFSMPMLLDGRASFVGWFEIDDIDCYCFFSKNYEDNTGSDCRLSMERLVGAWHLYCSD